MPVNAYARAIKNSTTPQYKVEGFRLDGTIDLQEIQVELQDRVTTEEDLILLTLQGEAGENEHVRSLFLRMPRSAAVAAARSILAVCEARLKHISIAA